MNRNRGGGKILSRSPVAKKKKKMDCRKVQLQEEEMETGCVGGSRPKAQREFVETRIATRLQVRSEIVGKNALIFAEGVSSYGQKKFRKEGEDFLKKNDSSTHVKRQTLGRKIRDSSSYDLFNGLKLNEKWPDFLKWAWLRWRNWGSNS